MGLILADQSRITAKVQDGQSVHNVALLMYEQLPTPHLPPGLLIFKTTQAVYNKAQDEHDAKFTDSRSRSKLRTFRGLDIVIDDELPADTIYLMPK